MEEILAMEHITKTYPGVKALDDVSISFIQGEVQAVMVYLCTPLMEEADTFKLSMFICRRVNTAVT